MKKFIAILLTLSMVLSLFAVPVSANGGGPAGYFDIDGNIVILDHVFEVTLPTQAFTIVVDPEGVLGDNDAGAINFTNGTPSFINRSSAPILLGVEARVTTEGTRGDTSFVNATSGDVGTRGDTTRYANITITPSAANVAREGGTFGGTDNETALVAAPTLLTFALPEANYIITGTAAENNLARVLDTDSPNLRGTQIRLQGEVTPNPSIWDDAVLGVRLRWSFIQAPVSLPGTAVAGSAHLRNIQRDTEVFDTMAAAVTGPRATATIAQVNGVDVITINAQGFSFPSGTFTVTGQRRPGGDTANIGSAVVAGSGNQITVTLAAAWSSGGTNQANADSSWFNIAWPGGNAVRVYKTNANVRAVSNVTVTLP